jgi:glycosyl transferase family 25
MEDDIALSSCLLRIAPSVDRILKQGDWGFIYFGHYATGFDQIADRNTDPGQISFNEWRQDLRTTYFYAVNGSIFPMLIEHLSAVENGLSGDQEMGPMPIDGAMNIFRRKNPSIQCLIANPRLGWQSSIRSDISPHRLDALTYLRPVAGFLRRVREGRRSWGR